MASTAVQLAAVLAGPVSAIAGAAIGYIAATRTARSDRHAANREAREARLFEHRRHAYAELITEVSRLFDKILDCVATDTTDELPGDLLDHLWGLGTDVEIYCSAPAGRIARRLEVLMSLWRVAPWRGPESYEQSQAFQSEIEDLLGGLTALARSELGVTENAAPPDCAQVTQDR